MLTATVNYIPSLVFIVVVALLTRHLISLASLLFSGVASGSITVVGFYPLILPCLPGSGSSAFQGVSIFLGVLLPLGSTAAVARIVAGVVITYLRAFQVGDRVRISDTEEGCSLRRRCS